MVLSDSSAEIAVLAGSMESYDNYLDVCHLLDPTTFTTSMNQALWKCISSIYNEDPSLVIDLSLLKHHSTKIKILNEFNDPNDLAFAEKVLNRHVTPKNLRSYAAKIRKFEVGRLLAERLETARDQVLQIDGTERVSEIFSIAENELMDLSTLLHKDDENDSYIHLGKDTDEYFQHLVDNPRELAGFSTGYPLVDQSIGGIRRKCAYVLAARTGVGKSVWSINMAIHVAEKLGIPVLYLDTEMDQEENVHRVWANLSKVDIDTIANGKFGQNDFKKNKVFQAKERLKGMPFFYKNVSGSPIEEVLAFARRWITKEVGKDDNGNTKDCLIIYDYLKLMTDDSISGNVQEYQAMGFQMTAVHNFAVKFDVPMFTFVQVNRDGIAKEGLEGISQSDRIAWLASFVFLYKEKSDAELADNTHVGNRKFIILKARKGQKHGNGEYIDFTFRGEIAELTELEFVKYQAPAKKKKGGWDNGDEDDIES